MKKKSSKARLVIAGAILFNIFFWNEKLGLNTVLYATFIAGCILCLYPDSLKNNTSRWLLLAHVITGAMVIFQNTVLSKIAFSTTIILFVCFSQYMHRS